MAEPLEDPIIPLSMVVHSIDTLREDMKDRIKETEERLQDRFDSTEARLDRIEEQTTATNGRVRTIEIWKARWDGTKEAFHWVPTLLAGLVGAAVAAGATELVGSLVH